MHELNRMAPAGAPPLVCPVSSHTEWDPLEEVIVGRLEGMTIPTRHVVVTSGVPAITRRLFGLLAGTRFPRRVVAPAQRELDGFIELLQREGIAVRRPQVLDSSRPVRTPAFTSRGFGNACPRDCLLVVGDEVIEAPMAWPSRSFEVNSYRRLIKDYFAQGARWTAAPRPECSPGLYEQDYRPPPDQQPMRWVTGEDEPVFDGADVLRCGRDLFVTRSNVTNHAGIEWLRRHLGERYRVHEVKSRSRQPMHLDTALMPLAPGKLLVNPHAIDAGELPRPLRSWDVLLAPEPEPFEGRLLRLTSMCGKWLSLNVLMLDDRRVVVEARQTPLIAELKRWGFEPIPCAFQHYAAFGGSFHSAALDVRRRGGLRSYF